METIDYLDGYSPLESLSTSIAFSNISTSFLDKNSSVICCVGAGISTQIGLRDFRSPNGLYNDNSNTISASKARSLFESSVYLQPNSRALHWKFIVKLHSQIEAIHSNSASHRFLKRLARKNKLRRVYSQNIDGLEGQLGGLSYVPLYQLLTQQEPESDIESMTDELNSGSSREYQGNVVQLHGSIQEVKCSLCNWISKWEKKYEDSFASGEALTCPSCEKKMEERVQKGKRNIRITSYIKPNLLLYDEPSPTSQLIASIANSDLSSSPTLLLVMGTSLLIPGFKNIVKSFAKEVRKNGGLCVFINLEEVSSEWDEIFDYQIKGKCEEVVKRFTDDWKASTPTKIKKESKKKRLHSTLSTTSISSTIPISLNSQQFPSNLQLDHDKLLISTTTQFNNTDHKLTPTTKRNSSPPPSSKRIRLTNQENLPLSTVHSFKSLPDHSTDYLTSINSPLIELTFAMHQKDKLELLNELWKEVGDVYASFKYSDNEKEINKAIEENVELVKVKKKEWKLNRRKSSKKKSKLKLEELELEEL